MRRSAAPSKIASSSKRLRIDDDEAIVFKPPASTAPIVQQPVSQPLGLRSSEDLLQLLSPKSKQIDQQEVSRSSLKPLKQRVIPPTKPATVTKPTIANINKSAPIQDVVVSGDTRFFSVLWCKLSAKKHKEWKEDAIMIVKNRTVILKNIDGKEIGQGSGYKLAQLEELNDGSTLVVGGKEVLIQEKINSPSFLSGPKASENIEEGARSPALTGPNLKGFVAPSIKGLSKANLSNNPEKIKPKFNPLSPNAFILPRPPAEILCRESRKGTVIVDVVVDPLLCRHLRPHQREGVQFLYNCVMGYQTPNMHGAILADEMGLGKTLQCITLIWTLLQQGPYNGRPTANRALIVTPSSLVKNWQKEFRRWLGTERINVYTVDQQHRPAEYEKNPLCPVMVVSYEMLVRCIEDIERMDFGIIVCDEGHRLKNAGNKTSSLINQLDCPMKVLVTGTPVQNDLKEFFTLADFVNPGILGSLSSFRRTYEDAIVAAQQPECSEADRQLGEGCADELSQLTCKFVLRRTQQVLRDHLPSKVENVVFCRPTTTQINLYRSLLDSGVVHSVLTGSYSGNDCLAFIQALRKLCNHPSLLSKRQKSDSCDENSSRDLRNELSDGEDDGDDPSQVTELLSKESDSDWAQKPSGKLKVTLSILDYLIDSTKEKIVLVSYSTKMLDLFGQACTKREYSHLRLDGSTPTTARMRLVDRFNDPQGCERIFLLSSKAGGVGLNLIGASRLLLYDIDWNPANDLQAMARIWRDGQKRTVHIYRLLTTGTIEEKIFQRQVMKQSLSGAVVDAKDSSKAHFTREDLKDLFSLREDVDSDTHDLINCPCNLQGEVIEPSASTTGSDVGVLDLDDDEDCRPSRNPNSNKTLDQLQSWQHYGPPFESGLFEDSCLEAAIEDVTFLFRCISTKPN